MAPFNKTKGALKLKLGKVIAMYGVKMKKKKKYMYARAVEKILEISRTYGKGHCTNLIVLNVPRTIDTNEIMGYNEKDSTR